MAEVQAFRGVRYRLDRPEAAAERISPPYDVISPAERDALEQKHPENVIRLELPKDQPGDDERTNRYTRAADVYRAWLESGVLRRDEAPCLYLYGQRYDTPSGPMERMGLFAALKAEPYEAKVVLPHEQTFPRHKEDRYRLITTVRAQVSPIFGLYSAPEAGMRALLDSQTGRTADAVAVDGEGVEHRLWAVSDPEFIRRVSEVFAGKQVFIADGHHRYETAVRHRQENRARQPDAPDSWFDYVMTFLVEMDDPGLVLLPTHRMVRSLGGTLDLDRVREYFTVEEVDLASADRLEHYQIGIVRKSGPALRLTLKDPKALDRFDREHCAAWRDLDVAILHRLLLQEVLGLAPDHEIAYTRSGREARERVASGEFEASFLLPAPRVEELKLVAGAGDKMPQKSTYFWPKAVTGLVIYGE
jgi:uncharacterized protein (DUF1015 family)